MRALEHFRMYLLLVLVTVVESQSHFLDISAVVSILFGVYVLPHSGNTEIVNYQVCVDIIKEGISPSLKEQYLGPAIRGIGLSNYIVALLASTSIKYRKHIIYDIGPDNFIANVLVSYLATLFMLVDYVREEDATLYRYELLIRISIGLLSAFSFNSLRKSLGESTSIGLWFSLLLLGDYNSLFNSSRLVVGHCDLPLIVFAYSQILTGNYHGLFWLAFAGTTFKREVLLLSFVIAIVSSIMFHDSSISRNLRFTVLGALAGAVVETFFESYVFMEWSFPLIKDARILYNSFESLDQLLNAVTVGPYDYFPSALTHTLQDSSTILCLALIGAFSGYSEMPQLKMLCISSSIYILLVGFITDGETSGGDISVISYIIPVAICAIANGALIVTRGFKSSKISKIITLGVFLKILVLILITVFTGFSDRSRYLGAESMDAINDFFMNERFFYELDYPVSVHIVPAATLSGASPFMELQISDILYVRDAAGDRNSVVENYESFHYLISDIDIDEKNDLGEVPSYDMKMLKVFSTYYKTTDDYYCPSQCKVGTSWLFNAVLNQNWFMFMDNEFLFIYIVTNPIPF